MKWLRTLVLFDQGDVMLSDDWRRIHESCVGAIRAIDHPRGSNLLKLRERQRLPGNKWRRNGVSYLRSYFLERMLGEEGWLVERGVDLSRNRCQPPIRLYPSMEEYVEPITSDFGDFDFVTVAAGGARVAVEWETGNISSSHRSMNKLAIALGNDIVDIGILIVPSRALYKHLTDRIGNIGELSGYLSMWESLKTTISRGLLAISVVEHDELTSDPKFPYLPRGKDGNAEKDED